MIADVAIVGAGVMGRLTALTLARRGARVSLFDENGASGKGSCSYAAAGMLAPFCELESASERITKLGAASLELWPRLVDGWDPPVDIRRQGSLVVAHPRDLSELRRLSRRVEAVAAGAFREIGEEALRALEPELDPRFTRALHFEREGHLDTREFLRASTIALEREGVHSELGSRVEMTAMSFPLVIDCRGLGARNELRSLRGVRGELFYVEAADVTLTRPIRMMHPRFPLYVVPRERRRFVIGATCVESDSKEPVTVRSTLELLSAAFALHSGFGEARVLESVVGIRPALVDNEPVIVSARGLLRINGLYRHGYLVSPRLAAIVGDFLEHGTRPEASEVRFEEAA